MKKQDFILEIDDAEDNTWEGTLRWLEGNKEWSFRSMIELLHLVDSALGENGRQFWDCSNPTEAPPAETAGI